MSNAIDAYSSIIGTDHDGLGKAVRLKKHL